MSLTNSQAKAISARGNVLVVAGAGTGKTHTLVERCLSCLLDEKAPASIEEILMVTFTEAAAAEMRQRIRDRMEQRLEEIENVEHKQVRLAIHLREQLANFELAHIGTLHSFCLELVRQHFYQLELDPQIAVLPEEEASLLAQETWNDLLEKHYSASGAKSEAVRELLRTQGRRGEEITRLLVMRLHHYTQTRVDPKGWFEKQIASFSADEPAQWREWLTQAVVEWRERWLPFLQRLAIGNEIAEKCLVALKKIPARPQPVELAAAFAYIVETCQNCPQGCKKLWLDPLKQFQDELDFLASLIPQKNANDPLVEDWNWARNSVLTLLSLAKEFAERFSDAKHELGVVDFHDLEQYALRLLWDIPANVPTKTGIEWRRRLRFVFVDEYQDINAAQDQIIAALSRDEPNGNRFLVGDVKQSIYRFRLADPSIFRAYMNAWRTGADHCSVPLTENFRSREAILNFANSFFSLLMREDLGGVSYDDEARLRFGDPENRAILSLAHDASPCVELRLRIKGKGGEEDVSEDASNGEQSTFFELLESEKEARLLGLRLLELKKEPHLIYDKESKALRPVEWSDMAVLLRSPANKAESYAKEFARLHIPLHVERGGFYRSIEISDLINLLRLLDNPLQDVPLLAVLHSPLVGLTTNELATVRLAAKGPFWLTLRRWHEIVTAKASQTQDQFTLNALPKVTNFLERYQRWRRLVRQASLSHCLEAILRETHYSEWLLTQTRGEQSHANVQRLLALVLNFDKFQRHSLFRFLCFVDAQQSAESEPEVAAVTGEHAVRLMSIHQSKGLEFPVVVLTDTGKAFNLSDLRADIILDEEFGLCPQVKPPHTRKKYPSLPHWLAQHRQKRESLAEELRLLYVAMTRARDTLILSGTVSKNKFEAIWKRAEVLDASELFSAASFADWLGLWFSQNCLSAGELAERGKNSLVSWTLQDETHLQAPSPQEAEEPQPEPFLGSESVWRSLRERLAWQYPFPSATKHPAKTSVTSLRRQAAENDDDGAAPYAWLPRRKRIAISAGDRDEKEPSGEDLGKAHHAFLQHFSLSRGLGEKELREEAKALEKLGLLAPEETALLDFDAMAAFWQSDLGEKIRAHQKYVRRELPFTARFSPNEIAAITGGSPDQDLEEEFIVVQGAVDLAVLLAEEIWIIDFKTDRVRATDLESKTRLYEPQLRLYAHALARIYRRPVTNCCLYFLSARKAMPINFLPSQVAQSASPR